MVPWVLGIALLTTPAPAGGQDPCPAGRPTRLVANVIPAIGQSPIWAATGGKPIAWEGPTTPVRVLWLRDVAVNGPAFLSGRLSAEPTTANAAFATSMYGARQARLTLDHIGDKPAGIKDADLRKYAFHWTFIWFPRPGCYAITGSVGTRRSVVYLNVAPAPKKTT